MSTPRKKTHIKLDKTKHLRALDTGQQQTVILLITREKKKKRNTRQRFR